MKRMTYNKGSLPSAEQLTSLEREVGHKLPQSFLQMVQSLGAAVPDDNYFQIVTDDPRGQTSNMISEFIPVDRLGYYYRIIKNNYDLPPVIPFADCAGGDKACVCVDEGNAEYGAIYYLEHELGTLTKLARTAGEFLANVHVDDRAEPDVKNVKVISVGISQEAKKLINEQRKEAGLPPLEKN